jgi:parallel beta-helix repeat protein
MKRLPVWLLAIGALATVLSVGLASAGPTPTPVTCGTVITTPGTYALSGDCVGSVGISIVASKVTLLLDGHTVHVLGLSSSAGIVVGHVSGVHILGPGTIKGAGTGIIFNNVSNSAIARVTTTLNDTGVFLGNSSGVGLKGNIATLNITGIRIDAGATGNKIEHNNANGNNQDLVDGNAGCDHNAWKDNSFTTANQTCIH